MSSFQTKPQAPAHDTRAAARRGLTLLEVMIAMAILGTSLAALGEAATLGQIRQIGHRSGDGEQASAPFLSRSRHAA